MMQSQSPSAKPSANHLQRLARAQALVSDDIYKGNFDGLLDLDDFGGIDDGIVNASSHGPSSNPSLLEPLLMPSIQSKLHAIFEAICDVFSIFDAFTDTAAFQ
jgi:hypothetical protein